MEAGPVFDPSVYDGTTPRLQARFFHKFVPSKAATEGKGIVDGKEIPYIEIQVDERNRVCRKATEQDKQEYALQWKAFSSKEEQPIVGTPLTECSVLTSKEQEMFKMVGLRSVEQLLTCPDTIMQRIPESYRMQKTVKRWADAGATRAAKSSLMKEIDELKAQNEYLQGEMEKMSKKFCEVTGAEYEPATTAKQAVVKTKTKVKEKQL